MDSRDVLERARRQAPVPHLTLLDLNRRRERRLRIRRVEAGALGLALAVVAAGTAFVGLREHRVPGPAEGGQPSVNLPPATTPLPVARPGQYYYTQVHLVGRCPAGQEHYCGGNDVELAATFWWSPDGSGRIEVDRVHNYGIHPGTFGPTEFPNPNGIDVANFPIQTAELTRFLLDRSAPDGASPAPLVTPPPGGASRDGQMWRAITDLLEDPHVTPSVRAALLDVAAGLQGARLEVGGVDPVGREADVVIFGNWGGELIERLYVDPASHDLLAITWTSEISDRPFQYFVVERAGVAVSRSSEPTVAESIPALGSPSPTFQPGPEH
ncbi:MAG TPA: hypothetical protein VEN95_06875 [Actinomycetota bacterium]|nr:hypothetical protein [Actinomycetota bacterium]